MNEENYKHIVECKATINEIQMNEEDIHDIFEHNTEKINTNSKLLYEIIEERERMKELNMDKTKNESNEKDDTNITKSNEEDKKV